MSVRNTVKSIQDIMRQDVGVDGDAQRISQLCWMFFLKIIDDQDQQLELMQDGYVSPIPETFQWRSWAADPEGMTGDELLNFINSQLFPQLKEIPVNGQPGDRKRVVRDVFEDAYNYMKSGQLLRQVINKINEVDFNNLAERQHFGDIYEQILNDLQSAGNAGEYYTPRAVTSFMVDRIDPKPGEVLLDPACGTGGFLSGALRHMRERYVKTVEDEQQMQQALRAVEKKQLPHMLCVTNMLLHGIEDPSFVRHDNTLARPYISYSASDRIDIVVTNPPFGGREEPGIETNFPKQFQTRETADLFLALIIRLLKPMGRAAVVLPDGSLFGEGVKTRLKEHLMEECNLHTIVRLPNSVFKPYANVGTNLLFFEKGEQTKEIWVYEHRVPAGQKSYSMTKPIKVEHLKPCVDWWGGSQRKGRIETEVAWRVDFQRLLEEARVRARPHWDAAEKFFTHASRLKATIFDLRSQIKELEKNHEEFKAGSKELQRYDSRLKIHENRLEDLTKELSVTEEKQRIAKRTGDSIYDAAFNLDFKNPHTIADNHEDPEELVLKLEAAEKQTAVLRDELKAILKEAPPSMNATQLFVNFDRIFNAPDPIPDLRQFILELAVRGKLVEQDAKDEPASELLKRIQAEKGRLTRDGALRKEKPLSAVLEEQAPFGVPRNWVWARIGTCALVIEYGTSMKSDSIQDGVPVLKMGDIQGGKVILGGQKMVSRDIDDLPQLFLKRFDLLYNRTNSSELVGKTGIYLGDDDAYTFASYNIRIRFLNHLTNPFFANIAMNAPYFRETQILPQLQQQCGQANVNGTKLRNMLIPFPPLAEQHRIVAKVQELTNLCDQLEAQLTTTQTQSHRLLKSVLHEALVQPA